MGKTRIYGLIQLITIIFLFGVTVRADSFSMDEAAKLLPAEIGAFKAAGPVAAFEDRSGYFTNVSSAAKRSYRSATGELLSVVLVTTKSDASAYASFVALTRSPAKSSSTASQPVGTSDIGTRSQVLPNQLSFFKGSIYVVVRSDAGRQPISSLTDLSRQLAAMLENGEGDVPVLVKHLPDWQQAEPQALYSLDLEELKNTIPNQPVLEAVSFEGGTEAVAANYGPSKLVIVEFNTPQLAGDNDRRIIDKIHELWNQGQPAPTAYRRVGNYSVFVFNAPNDQTANQLIDQVKYEQVVQWLGDNPNWLKEAQRRYTETTLGLFVSVVKASGVAAVLCFGIGGFFGALLFARRRAQQKSAEAYSDAGGMMRLNLDEIQAETNTGKLLGSSLSDKL